MKNQTVGTSLGVIVLVIIAITVGAFSWKIAKNREVSEEPTKEISTVKKPTVTKTQAEVQPVAQAVPTDETANWKTYTDIKYGIEFKYPAGYKTIIDENAGDPSFSLNNPEKDIRVSGDGPYPQYAFTLSVLHSFIGGDPDKFQTPAEWAKNQKKLESALKEETINGIAFYTSDTETGGGQKIKENYTFLKKGNAYDLYTITYKKSDVGQEILSTLKFTK